MNKKLKTALVLSIILLCQLTTVLAQNNGEKIENIQSFCSSQKGFNLLGKFDKNWNNQGFKEKEFQVISDLGFNFVRLPVDYRTYTLTNNWNYFVESWLKNFDDAINWGQKYNVHVCLNLHSAPGYCVNAKSDLPAEQQRDLWTDTVAQNVFVNHWKFFAERYKNVSPHKLSFNLVNEPNTSVAKDNYVKVMKMAIHAIHEITPDRLIFVDALNFASDIIVELKDEANVAQAIHSYQPFRLTHYMAGWVEGSDSWPVPNWPVLQVNNHLYGSWKSEFKSPLVVKGNFSSGTKVVVNVNQVSAEATLQIKSESKTIYSKKFVSGPNLGEDFTQLVQTQWGYQNISNKDYSVVLESASTQISFENSIGDWMTINSISFVNDTDSLIYFLGDNSWGVKQKTYVLDEKGVLKTEDGKDLLPFQEYQDNIQIAKENGIPFMVQEFGVFNKTPHKVSIAFLNDLMDFFNENNIGWAIWNLEGGFGILNSGRSDVNYEPFNGYQLDRQMLNVLLKVPTAANLIDTKNDLNIYPNPAQDKLNIRSRFLVGDTKIVVHNILGKTVKRMEVNEMNQQSFELNVSNLQHGIYLVSVQNKGTVFTQKVIVN